jgi:serine/threonine-protein kinase
MEETVSQNSLKRGTRLDRYEIRELLGQGGMGQVYRAWDLTLQRDVAVKILWVPDADLLRRFAREAKAISQLSNANVVTIHDFHAEENRPYIVMEHLRGEDLSTRLRRGPMQVGEAVDMILGVCSGVYACHCLGIIHRDLKPGNVFLQQTAEFGVVVKVLDFGVAMLRQGMSEEITQPGYVVGTPRYLSPEQVRHIEADAKSDQYGIGLLLYTALAGKSPFAKKEGSELIRAIMTADYPSLREILPDVPGDLEDAISKAMRVDRGHRYPSVLAFGRDIAKHATRETRAPLELFSSLDRLDSSTDLGVDDSRTKVDIPAEIVASGQDANSMDRREQAAAGVETLEGDDSRPAFGSVVVPIAPFQMMPVVSTTARLPTETAIDLSFGVAKHAPVHVEKPVAHHRRSQGKASSSVPETGRKSLPCASVASKRPTHDKAFLGLERRKLLLVLAALAVVVLVAVAIVVMSLRSSRSQVPTGSRKLGDAKRDIVGFDCHLDWNVVRPEHRVPDGLVVAIGRSIGSQRRM